jgi:hypothetical protein
MKIPGIPLTEYYHLTSPTMRPWNLTDRAYDIAQSTWLCAGCVSPKPF